MSDMIYRQDAINVLEGLSACEEYGVEVGTDEETYIGKYEAITAISDLPSADRPKGEWRNLDGEPVPLDEGGCPTESAWCSECGTWLVASDEHSVIGRYCPNCGARMKGADDE